MTNIAFKVLQALITQSVTQKWAFLCSSEVAHIYVVLNVNVASIISYLSENMGEIFYL